MSHPQQVYIWLLDLIFPVRCIGCRRFGNYVCRRCFRAILIKKNFECIGCKKTTPFGQTCFLCAKTNSIDQLLIAADYNDSLIERSLKFLKYRFISVLERPLSVLVKKYLKWLTLDKKFNVFDGNPLVVPVPLHRRRLNWRGFNQSELLAKELADTFQMELAINMIARTNSTVPQADIREREQRLKNLNGIFQIKNGTKIVGREILLIDDICTTGATLNECAKILKENGAGRITGLVVARG